MTQRHSSTAHAAYHELVRSLLDKLVADMVGTPTRVERNGRVYWYDSFRVGNDVRKTNLGEDSADLRARIERYRELVRKTKERRQRRLRLVRILRAEGFMGLDSPTESLISALAKVGVFRLGGTIAGTHAFRPYEGELGVGMSLDDAVVTDDIDIASFERLSLALDDDVSEPLRKAFSNLSFDPVPPAFLIRVLAEDRPGELENAYRDALDRGGKWRRRMDNTLRKMPEIGGILRGL